MMRLVALVMVLLCCCCSSCFAEEIASPVELVDDLYVGANGDLQPGWYSAVPSPEGTSKLTIVDTKSFDKPVIVASYSWWEAESVLADSQEGSEGYVFPLWEGCFVLSGYYGGLEYDSSSCDLSWDQMTDTQTLGLVYVAPLGGDAPSAPAASEQPSADEDSKLLYEDDRLAIRYSDFYVVSYDDNSYLKIQWLIENKTDEIIDVTCKSITVNGCAVHISKYVDVPPACQYLHEWTDGAELYLRYGIDEVESFSAVITINNGQDIVTNEIAVK